MAGLFSVPEQAGEGRRSRSSLSNPAEQACCRARCGGERRSNCGHWAGTECYCTSTTEYVCVRTSWSSYWVRRGVGVHEGMCLLEVVKENLTSHKNTKYQVLNAAGLEWNCWTLDGGW